MHVDYVCVPSSPQAEHHDVDSADREGGFPLYIFLTIIYESVGLVVFFLWLRKPK